MSFIFISYATFSPKYTFVRIVTVMPLSEEPALVIDRNLPLENNADESKDLSSCAVVHDGDLSHSSNSGSKAYQIVVEPIVKQESTEEDGEDCLQPTKRRLLDSGHQIVTTADEFSETLGAVQKRSNVLPNTQSSSSLKLSSYNSSLSSVSSTSKCFTRSQSDDLIQVHQNSSAVTSSLRESSAVSSTNSLSGHRIRRYGVGQMRQVPEGYYPDDLYFPQGNMCRRFSTPVGPTSESVVREGHRSSKTSNVSARTNSRSSIGVRRFSDFKSLTTTLGFHLHGSLLSLAGTYDKAFKVV